MKDGLKRFFEDKTMNIAVVQRTLSIRLPADLYEAAQVKATKNGLSMTQLVRGLLESFLEAEDGEK